MRSFYGIAQLYCFVLKTSYCTTTAIITNLQPPQNYLTLYILDFSFCSIFSSANEPGEKDYKRIYKHIKNQSVKKN